MIIYRKFDEHGNGRNCKKETSPKSHEIHDFPAARVGKGLRKVALPRRLQQRRVGQQNQFARSSSSSLFVLFFCCQVFTRFVTRYGFKIVGQNGGDKKKWNRARLATNRHPLLASTKSSHKNFNRELKVEVFTVIPTAT